MYLNVWHQLTIIRMAIVIPTSERRAISEIIVPKNAAVSGKFEAPCWTGTVRTNDRIKSRLRRMNGQGNWTKDFLDDALAGIGNLKHGRHHVVGIRCPEPLGIVTYEDIVDAILQQKNRDEKDFYYHGSTLVNAKGTVSTLQEMVSRPKLLISRAVPNLSSDLNNRISKSKNCFKT